MGSITVVRCGVLLAAILATTLALRGQTPPVAFRTPVPPAPVQPLPYSHRQHLELDLECTDCHVNPDGGARMTFPATETCASCHTVMPSTTPALEKLAAFAASNDPIPWVRVYQLADYVYWSHPAHLAAGIACVDCHGPVPQRDAIALETIVTTKTGCVTCHETRQVLSDCGDCHEPRQ